MRYQVNQRLVFIAVDFLADSDNLVRRARQIVGEPHWLTDTDFVEATNFLEKIENGVRSEEIQDQNVKKSLREWRDRIIADLKSNFDATVTVGPLKLKRTDNVEEVFHEFPKFDIQFPAEA